MSRDAEVYEANVRIKRWLKAACDVVKDDKPLVTNPGEPVVSYSPLLPLASRWRIHERRKFASMIDNGPDRPDSIETIREFEACVASAQSWGEALMMYARWAQDENRDLKLQDRQLRGELMRPPPDPPEWAEQRRAAIAAAEQAGERTSEWVRKSAWGDMKAKGFDDPVRFALAWDALAARGMVPK